jgi:hypothetical protein
MIFLTKRALGLADIKSIFPVRPLLSSIDLDDPLQRSLVKDCADLENFFPVVYNLMSFACFEKLFHAPPPLFVSLLESRFGYFFHGNTMDLQLLLSSIRRSSARREAQSAGPDSPDRYRRRRRAIAL